MPWHYPVHGIDVSKYQGDIDWQPGAASGVSFAFIKATEGGDRVDEQFRRELAAATAAGVPRGAYHFYYFCRPAEEQARWFIRHVPRDRSALPPVLDMEWNPNSPHLQAPARPRDRAQRDASVFLNDGEAPLRQAADHLHHRRLLRRQRAVDSSTTITSGCARSPAIPREIYRGHRCTFWQYTGTGVVPGIDGPTDLNVFAGSFQQIVNLTNGG